MEEIIKLRHELHCCPEISGSEVKTKKLIIKWLKENTSLEIKSCGDGFYAAHREVSAEKSIALRADYDALALPEGGASHLCGHDGHAAALCGTARALEHEKTGKNIFLIFQPAEETGAGAQGPSQETENRLTYTGCCEIFRKESIDEIYGLHNLPGFEFGQVFTKSGTFACASRGLTIKLDGAPAHAAYPENGISPANAVGRLLCMIPELSDPSLYSGMTMCTVIGVQMGEKAFGAAASDAEIWLTLRGEHDADIAKIQQKILGCAGKLAAEYRLGISTKLQDVFPSTENDPECAAKVIRACSGKQLDVPMRWSEDFGHYLHYAKGAFFGLGAGKTCPALHTRNYEYPDALLPYAVEAFMNIVCGS